jgi:hypothetical protein
VNAVVLRAASEMVEAQVRKHNCRVVVSDGWELQGERTLFVAAGTAVPYRLLDAGFGFLDRWDLAAPLWRYGMLAENVGTAAERERTRAVTLDLRLLLYGHELLFVRDNAVGRQFLEMWLAEGRGRADHRLAFLRALHLVKPKMCTLPGRWLQRAEVQVPLRRTAGVGNPAPEGAAPLGESGSPHDLGRVQVGRRRYVQCRRHEVEETLARFREARRKRGQPGSGDVVAGR